MEKKYCKCESELVIANLKTGKGECPFCKLPKKLSLRLKNMSKTYQEISNKNQTQEDKT